MSLEINLLHQHATSRFTQRAIKTLRMSTILLGIVVLVSLAILFYLTKKVEMTVLERSTYQKEVLNKITQNQDKETGALLLNQKYKEIDAVIKAEPPYLSYFDTILRELPNSSASGKIASAAILKTGNVSAQITFPDILALTKFLSKVESDEFKQNFSSIKTSSVSFNKLPNKELLFSLDVKF